MRRAGGWILGVLIVAAMAVGGGIALRPLFTRETVRIGYFRATDARGPSNDAMFSGAAFAVEEAGRRAGRFRIEFTEVKPIDSKLPPVWMGTSEALLEPGDFQPYRFRISVMDTHPRNIEGQLRILPGFTEQGAAAARWARASEAAVILLLRDTASPRGASIAGGFSALLPLARIDHVDPLEPADKRATLIGRILSYSPDLVFYSGEEAPYGTSDALFSALRAKGYAGKLLMAEADPEVSYLAVPCRVPEGTLLLSPIGPPSKEFASQYEPATGRHAGPHGWVGYLAMKAALGVIENSKTASGEEFQSLVDRQTPTRPCALYVARDGKFAFLQDLK